MNNKRSCFVGFDTSNYTTSAAVSTIDGEIVANLKIPLPVKAGESGLRQSDAVFAHVKNIPQIADELKKLISEYHPLAVGVSSRPRDAEGSYMPCFLAGVAEAHAFAAGIDAPVYEFSHQSGHIMAAKYSAKMSDDICGRFLAFHVSGGTTEAVIAEDKGDTFAVTLVGETSDLNAGQAIDRVGVAMGFHFPCGPGMEKAAIENTKKIPKPKISVKGGKCNLSGVENLAARLYSESGDTALVSAFVFDFIAETLDKMTENLLAEVGNIPVLYAGGVMSNSIIKAKLSRRKNTFFAEPAFSADNAAGIALLARKRYLKNN